MAKDRHWDDIGPINRMFSAIPAQLGVQAGQLAHAKWMLDPRRPNAANRAWNTAVNNELYKLKPSATKMNIMGNKAWWQQIVNPAWGSHYNPKTNTVNVATKFGAKPGNVSPGVFGHELGHSQQFTKGGKGFTPKMNALQTVSRASSMIGLTSLPLYFADKESTAQKFAAVGTAAAAPLLYNEFDASRKGRNMLKTAATKSGQKLSFMKSLAPFKGMPSYLMAAALPYVTYKYLKSRGKYQKEEQIKRG